MVVDGFASSRLQVSSGVPQGSILGPLLFLVFVNDIVKNLSCEARLFADDCVIYREIRTRVFYNKNLDNLFR